MTEYERLVASWSQRPMTRRELLRRGGRGALGVSAMALLAACGVQGEARRPQRKEALPPKAGELVMANWPLYIDKSGPISPTVRSYEEQHEVDMQYQVVINDNEEFFGTIREPLAQGDPTGFDIIVMTDWMIEKLVRLGYLEQLHHEELPNFEANAAEKFKDPWFDPDNKHSVPWAAGITGIGYDIELTGRELTSFTDLFADDFAGQVGMFLEMRDTFGLALLSQGVEPVNATMEDVEGVQQLLIGNRDKIRGFYGNDYADQLAQGNLVASMAWSGDIFALQLDNPNLRFVIPAEGAVRWSDNMAIPAGAEHPTDAHLFMDHVYEPRTAANITEWVWYESPVEGVQQIVQEDVADGGPGYLRQLADSDLVFPTEETNAQTHTYKRLDEEEEQAWNDLWQAVVVG